MTPGLPVGRSPRSPEGSPAKKIYVYVPFSFLSSLFLTILGRPFSHFFAPIRLPPFSGCHLDFPKAEESSKSTTTESEIMPKHSVSGIELQLMDQVSPSGGAKAGSICHFAFSLLLQYLGGPTIPRRCEKQHEKCDCHTPFVCPKCLLKTRT